MRWNFETVSLECTACYDGLDDPDVFYNLYFWHEFLQHPMCLYLSIQDMCSNHFQIFLECRPKSRLTHLIFEGWNSEVYNFAPWRFFIFFPTRHSQFDVRQDTSQRQHRHSHMHQSATSQQSVNLTQMFSKQISRGGMEYWGILMIAWHNPCTTG